MKLATVSIVIATYRRPEMLRDCVLSLRDLTIPPGVAVEVLVIDNDPAGSSGDVRAELAVSCGDVFELRYILEPRTGVSHARNRGIDEAQGDVVAFLDDDVFVSKGWLVAMLDCLEQTGAAAAGGRIETCWEGEPNPIVRECDERLGVFTMDRGERDFRLRRRCGLGGGNSAFRRSALDGGLRFPTDLGPTGKTPVFCEDTELFLRVRQRGLALWYCAGAVVRHRVGGQRLTADYLVQRNFLCGCSYAIVDRRLRGKLGQTLTAAARLGKLVLVVLPRLTVAWLRGDATQRLVARCLLATQAGYLRATILPLIVATSPARPASRQPDERLIAEPTGGAE